MCRYDNHHEGSAGQWFTQYMQAYPTTEVSLFDPQDDSVTAHEMWVTSCRYTMSPSIMFVSVWLLAPSMSWFASDFSSPVMKLKVPRMRVPGAAAAAALLRNKPGAGKRARDLLSKVHNHDIVF